MKKSTVVLVAVMVVLAGCSGGGGTATPTDTEAADETEDGEMTPGETTEDGMTPGGDDTPMDGGDDTPMDGGDETPMDGGDQTPTDGDDGTDDQDSAPNAREALSNFSSSDPFSEARSIEMTLINGSQRTSVSIKNNTNTGQELIQVDSPDTETTLYSTEDYAAIRNFTSGETIYEAPDGRNATGIKLSAGFLFLGGFIFTGFVEWDESPSQTTIDGESVYVIEGNSLNESAFDNPNLNTGFDPSDVQSVDGRFVITTDGQIRSIDVEITTPSETYRSELSISPDQPSITKPSWVDESQAPN
jgi:hypothetical protein